MNITCIAFILLYAQFHDLVGGRQHVCRFLQRMIVQPHVTNGQQVITGRYCPCPTKQQTHLTAHYRVTPLSAVYAVVVRLCVSVTLRYCIKTAKRRITRITPHNSAMTLVFWCQISWRNSNGITTNAGGGSVKIRHFRRKTRYNSKTVQDRRIVSIKVE